MRLNKKKVGVIVGALLSLVVSFGVAADRTPQDRTVSKDVKGGEGSSTDQLSEQVNEDENAFDIYYSGIGEVTARTDHWYVTFTNLQPPISFALSSAARLKNFPLDQTIVGEVSIDLIDNLTHGVACIDVDTGDTTKTASLKVARSEVLSIGKVLRQIAEVTTRPADGPTDEGGVAGVDCACASCCTCDGKCSACCETGWQPQCSCEGSGRCRCVPPPN